MHIPVVKELLKVKYKPLVGIACEDLKYTRNQKLLKDINVYLVEYYDIIRKSVKEHEVKKQLSDTLITKILIDTLGCVSAYARCFFAGIKAQGVEIGNYNINSILKLVNFYEKNAYRLQPVRKWMLIYDLLYPQMKMLDIRFWQIGFELDTQKGLKVPH